MIFRPHSWPQQKRKAKSMPKIGKSDVKAVGAVVIGVMLAGFVMNQFGQYQIIDAMRRGYDY